MGTYTVAGVENWLGRQDGVISRTQAVAAGMSTDSIRRRVRTEQWLPVHAGVYIASDRAWTARTRVRAAVLGAGPDATAHGMTAAWWDNLTSRVPTIVDVTVPRRRKARTLPGVRIRRRDLSHLDRLGLRDLWLTTTPLTVLEAAVAAGEAGAALLDRALQRRVGYPMLYRTHCRTLGRHGSPAAAALLAAATDRAGSQAELLLKMLLRRAGITGWIQQPTYLGYEVDFAFVAERVIIEVDGWAWHVDEDRFQADRVKQNALINAHWRVLRFTWHDLTARSTEVIAEIGSALGR